MIPELKAYLDYIPDGKGGYDERKRLKALIPPGVLKTHYQAQKDAFFVDNKQEGKPQEELSPSGKYKLVIGWYGTKPGSWSYSQGKILRIGSDEPIAVVNRNYSAFPFAWIEGHPNGHPYFVGGEDYQGQTIVELDTGKRRDHLPAEAEEGHAFCWAEARFDTATKLLVVLGCHWACPYEFRFYDFSEPMSGWPEVELADSDTCIDDDRKWPIIGDDGLIRCFQTEEQEDDDAPPAIGADLAIKTFRRAGAKFELVDEWVSDVERERRVERAEGEARYKKWIYNFKATDPLYLAYLELVKDPALSPEEHCGIGVTHDRWCPHFTGREKRWCRRIVHENGGNTIDLEWACETGPVKLVIYKLGKHVEDKFFEHSVAGMNEAFAYAKDTLKGTP